MASFGVNTAAVRPLAAAGKPIRARASATARPSHHAAAGPARRFSAAPPRPLAPSVVCRVATAIHRDSVPSVDKLRTKEEFHNAVEDDCTGLVVITVGAQTCFRCEVLNQRLAEDTCYEFLNVRFFQLNGDETSENYKMVKAWGTTELPEVRIYFNGELLEKMVTYDTSQIHERLQSHLCEKLDICHSSDIDF
mmetsp:Transcript_5692/g.14609  ORF Transcript_5692/g.14609 Transcript_5692/m.14609 type:complete len:193 (+) Transcript_5692:540-1118(+)